jgi:hypothetical protein
MNPGAWVVLILAPTVTLLLSAAEPTPGDSKNAPVADAAPAAAPATAPTAAATPAAAEAARPAAASSTRTASGAASAATTATAAATTSTTADDAARAAEPERFEATEKVRADFEVSFPVDI